MHHPSRLNPKVVAKVVARRGRLHAYEALEPSRTALVVVDLNTAAVEQSEPLRAMLPRVNALAQALRSAGGTVAWVTARFSVTANTEAIFGADAARFAAELAPGSEGTRLHPGLVVARADLHAEKTGASAFFPGKCNLDSQLRALGIEMVLIAGTVTNVCCESSARDAVEAGYRVMMISDCCDGHSHGLHEASLTTFYRCFGDVRPVDDTIELIRHGALPR